MTMDITQSIVEVARTERHYSASDPMMGRDLSAVETQGQTTIRYMGGPALDVPTDMLGDLIELVQAVIDGREVEAESPAPEVLDA